MAICFKSTKQPDKFYNTMDIDFIDSNDKLTTLTLHDKILCNKNTGSLLHFDHKDIKIIVNYNPKFQNAVIEYLSPTQSYIRNVHRIRDILMGDEVNQSPEIKKLSECGPLTVTEDNRIIPNPNFKQTPGEIMYNIFQVLSKAHCETKSPQQVLLELEAYRQVLNEMNKSENTKHPIIDNYEHVGPNANRLIIRNGKIVVNTYDLDEYVNIDKLLIKAMGYTLPGYRYIPYESDKTFKYPLIYKLKERGDYKNMKSIFDKDYVNKRSFAALVYDHLNDRCVIQLIQSYEPNYTVLDVWKKQN